MTRYESSWESGMQPDTSGAWVRYEDHIAALKSVRQILSETCNHCQGTCLPEEKPNRTMSFKCIQCHKWNDGEPT